jgi:tape measure domain-containing protein
MSSLVFRITGDPASFKAAMGEVSSSLDRAGQKALQTSQQIGALGNKLTLGITLPAVAAGTAVIKAAADMDALKRGLVAVAGSADEAEKQFVALREVAKLPGIGLKEAVQGSINLQALGFSAQRSRDILISFGNALATVGRGREDLNEVIRQLGQLASRGKVTMDNLRPIIERVPQVAGIIKREFGGDVLGDPAKAFERLGVSSEQFVNVLVRELGKLPLVTSGAKNALENFQDAVQISAARIGDRLLPTVEKVLPVLESMAIKVADVADEFGKLPEPTQNTAIAVAGVVVAAGPLLSVLSKLQTALPAVGQGMAIVGAGLIVMRGLREAADNWALINRMVGDFVKKILDTAKPLVDFHAAVESRITPAVRSMLDNFETWRLKLVAISPAIDALVASSNVLANAIAWLQGKTLAQVRAEAEHEVYQKRIYAGFVQQAEGARQSAAANTGATAEVKKLTQATSDAANIIRVKSVADLIHVEALERVKTAVGKVKDVMFEYSRMGTIFGGQLEYHRSSLDAAAGGADAYRLALAEARFELEALGKMPPIQMATPTQPTRTGNVFEADDILRGVGASSTRETAQNVAALEAALARIKQLNAEGKATGNDVIAVQEALKRAQEGNTRAATAQGKAQSAAMRQVSTVLTDLSRGITDVIFRGGKLGDMFKNVAMQAAQSITRLLIEGALTKLAAKILDVGGLFGKVFSGGTGAVMSATGSAASSAAGSGASAAAGIAGGVASGAMGMVGAIAGIGSLISGVVGNFQMMGMNKTLDLIEKEVRYSQIHLLAILEKQNEYLPKLKDIWDSLIRMETRQMEMAGGGGMVLNFTGNTFGSDMTQGTVDAMFRTAIDKFKRQGLN